MTATVLLRDVISSSFFLGAASCGVFARISDLRAHQLASNATPIRELGVLVSDEQRCPWSPGFRGRLQRRARLSTTQECCDQNAQMVRCPNAAARIRDPSPPRGRQPRSAIWRLLVSLSGLTGFCAKLRSCRGASAGGFRHLAGQPCLFRRDCTFASRHVRVLFQASGGKRCGGGGVAGASGSRELRLRLTNLFVSSATTPTRRRVGANTRPAPRPAPKNGI